MKHKNILKSLFLLLLAGAIIAAGARLPAIAAAWQARDNEISYADISPVELSFEDDGIPIAAKISILSDPAEFLEIPSSLASRTPEEIQSIFTKTLDSYIQAGLVQQADGETSVTCQAYITFDSLRSRSVIFWDVRMSSWDWSFSLYLDDETGTVCSVDYIDYINLRPDLQDVLVAFSGLYLAGLGEEFPAQDPARILEEAEYQGDSCISSTINWGDVYYGETRITFWVQDCGFFTALS